jgi:hypothetical protein
MKCWSKATPRKKRVILNRGLLQQERHRGMLRACKFFAAEYGYKIPSKWTDLTAFSALYKLVHKKNLRLSANDYFLICDTRALVLSF